MPKAWFKSWIPSAEAVKKSRSLGFIGHLLADPSLFQLNRHSVSNAVFIGLFLGFLPIIGQNPLAALLAVLFRCNLPIAVSLVWVSNPLTFAFIYYLEYRIGSNILMLPECNFHLDLTWQWFSEEFPKIWKPLVLGSIIVSLFTSCLGYLLVQWGWRWAVARNWRQRQHRRGYHS